jgi:hypothetical protein
MIASIIHLLARRKAFSCALAGAWGTTAKASARKRDERTLARLMR